MPRCRSLVQREAVPRRRLSHSDCQGSRDRRTAGGDVSFPRLHMEAAVLRALGRALLTLGVLCVLPGVGFAQPESSPAIRPYPVHVSQQALTDLRPRIAETRWPDKETVADPSQGAQLDPFEKLVRYWGTSYDWRKAEAKLNALPQFTTTIDGVDIYFIQVKSKQ